MIKRPSIWILGAYLTGMFLAWEKQTAQLSFLSMLLAIIIIYLFMYYYRKKIIRKRNSFLWALPFLLLLGFLAMNGQLKPPALYEEFEQEVACELSGSISMIVKKPSVTAIYMKNNEITIGGKNYLCENVIVYASDYQFADQEQEHTPETIYQVGNQIKVKGTLQKFSSASNPGQFNEQLYYLIENIDFKMQAESIEVTDAGYSYFHAALNVIKSRMLQAYNSILSDKEAGTLIAMLLGEKYLLDDEIKELYQKNGISHVLAISGLHVSLIGLFLFGLLRRLKLPIIPATLLSVFFIYCYGVLTGFSISTVRAVVMMAVFLLAPLLGKTYDMLSASAISAFLILLQNPLQILSAGFLLSYSAILGIAILLPCLKRLFKTGNVLINSVLVSSCAQVSTAPFVIFFYYQFPVYGILTNLIILPFVTVLTLTSLLAGMAGILYLPLGVFLIGGANYILKFYEWVCKIMNRLPGNLLTVGKPELLRLLLYFILILLFVLIVQKSERKLTVLLPLVAFLMLILPQKKEGFEVTFLDVGQGDAIYMESRNGTTYLVDGGSADIQQVGEYRLKPFLLSQGTDTVDYAVMTHADSDHTNGLTELMSNDAITIKNLILPELAEKEKAYKELEQLATQNGIKLIYIQAGDLITDGDLRMFCLHPGSGYAASSSNDNSTVLGITFGEFDLLLTGDLEKDGEALVAKLPLTPERWQYYGMKPASDYDVLKVAHHGSKNSTSEEFLSLIKPEISIISCGKDNEYGHPHQEVLSRLENIQSDIRITWLCGAVTIKTDGKQWNISDFNTKENRK